MRELGNVIELATVQNERRKNPFENADWIKRQLVSGTITPPTDGPGMSNRARWVAFVCALIALAAACGFAAWVAMHLP